MRSVPLLLSGVVVALAAASQAPGAPPAGGPVAPRPRPSVSPRAVLAPPDYVARRALPDSVLLRIDGREDITRRRFARAVRLLGGDPDSLTPVSRDRFLELVIEQRLLAAHATRSPLAWDPSDSAEYRVERDNVLLRAAMSDEFARIEQRRRALGQPDLDDDAMGVAARESLMLELRPVYDTDLLRRVSSYFAELPQPTSTMSPREQLALAEKLPAIPAADTLRVLARSRLGDFTVADLIADWRRLSSVYRPRVETDEAVRALVQNSLFERSIREAAAVPALAQRYEVASVLADRVEYHGVTAFLRSQVAAKIPLDSLTLLAYYRTHRPEFDRPARAVMVLLTLDNERAADSLAHRFTIPGEAESLAVRAQRSGVMYTHVATAASDSALYALAVRVGTGGVAGPDHVENIWRLFKVLSLDPRTSQPFADVRDQVARSWADAETERRIRALLDSLKRAARLERNERALREIAMAAPRRR